MFSVCMLLYGDYPGLAKRLFGSLQNYAYVQDFRIGLNSVSAGTLDALHTWINQDNRWKRTPVYVYEDNQNRNLGKYPLMREMFKDSKRPASRIMWFDDDSFLDPTANELWWENVSSISTNKTQIGAVHYIRQRNKQYEVVKQQDWYTGKSVNSGHRFIFATGGWWVADTQFLLKWDYPFRGLHHNGGDSILGELIRQQAGTLVNFKEGCQCHCESCNKSGIMPSKPVVHINVGGRKGRRGIGVTDEQYIWADGNPSPSLAHHNFDLRISRYAI